MGGTGRRNMGKLSPVCRKQPRQMVLGMVTESPCKAGDSETLLSPRREQRKEQEQPPGPISVVQDPGPWEGEARGARHCLPPEHGSVPQAPLPAHQ